MNMINYPVDPKEIYVDTYKLWESYVEECERCGREFFFICEDHLCLDKPQNSTCDCPLSSLCWDCKKVRPIPAQHVSSEYYKGYELAITFKTTYNDHTGYCSDGSDSDVFETVDSRVERFPVLKLLPINKIYDGAILDPHNPLIQHYYGREFDYSHGSWCRTADESDTTIVLIIVKQIAS